jgi:hypothetical protein
MAHEENIFFLVYRVLLRTYRLDRLGGESLDNCFVRSIPFRFGTRLSGKLGARYSLRSTLVNAKVDKLLVEVMLTSRSLLVSHSCIMSASSHPDRQVGRARWDMEHASII